jgi:hypothetical protein
MDQITVLVDYSQAFDMIIHRLMLLSKLKNLQNYSDGARMLVYLYFNGKTQFVRCCEKESSNERVHLVFHRDQSLIRFVCCLY